MAKYAFVNLITVIAAILGSFSIALLYRGLFRLSFGLALIAFVFDFLDGYLARRLKAQTSFGAWLDTLSDIMIYVAYPTSAFYLYYGFQGPFATAIIVIFVFAALFRLVRFTMKGFLEEGERNYYQGLPVVFSHLVLLVTLLASEFTRGKALETLSLSLILATSVAMVLKFKFPKPQGKMMVAVMGTILLLAGLMFFGDL